MHSNHALAYPEFRLLLGAMAGSTLANQSLVFLVGYQIVQRIPDPALYLGYLGLAQAIPALGLALVGGHLADSMDRRRLLLITVSIQFLCGSLLFGSACFAGSQLLWWIYPAMFLMGLARSIAAPTLPSLEAELVPKGSAVQAATIGTGVWQACAVSGPMIAGFMIAYFSLLIGFAVALSFYILAGYCLLSIRPHGAPKRERHEPILTSMSAGIRYVFSTPLMWSSMSIHRVRQVATDKRQSERWNRLRQS